MIHTQGRSQDFLDGGSTWPGLPDTRKCRIHKMGPKAVTTTHAVCI